MTDIKQTNGKTRIDVMVDLETLGTDFSAPIFQIASASFDIETGEIIEQFNKFADIESLDKDDGDIDGGTLKWWLNTNKELFAELLNKEESLTPYGLLAEYHFWLKNLTEEYDDVYLWGNGILFDNAILKHKFENYSWKYPVFFRNDRDVRTIFELARHKTGETAKEMYERIYNKDLEAHDAVNDVKNQIALVSECYRIITKGER